MTFHIKILVYYNQEYENVTTSANNLVLWQKLRKSKGKSPKTCQKMAIWTILGFSYSSLDKNQ